MDEANGSGDPGDRPIGFGEQATISYKYLRSLIERGIIDDRYATAIGPVERQYRADLRDLLGLSTSGLVEGDL